MIQNGSMNTRIHLARTGSFVDGGERAVTIDAALLTELAESYDAGTFKAPLVLGHPQDGAPAYGWVEKLVVEGDSLYGEVDQVAPQLSEAVKAGRYRNVSISFWPKGNENSPAKGAATLRHVGILGAQAPVIKGLEPLALSEALDLGSAEGVQVIEFSESKFALRVVRDLFRGLRDWIIDTAGQEQADRIAPAYSIDFLTEAAASDDAAVFAERPKPETKSEEPAMTGDAKTDPIKLAEAEAEAARLRAEVAELKAKGERDAAAARQTAAVEFAEGMINEGKLAPAGKDAVAAIHQRLAADGDVFEFADGSKEPPLKAFTDLLGGAKPIIVLAEVAAPDQSTDVDAKDPRALTKRANEIMKEDGSLQFSEAIRKAEEEAEK